MLYYYYYLIAINSFRKRVENEETYCRCHDTLNLASQNSLQMANRENYGVAGIQYQIHSDLMHSSILDVNG